MRGFVEVAEILREQQLVMRFTRRTGGDIEKTREGSIGATSRALDNVSSNRSNGSTKLSRESEAFVAWKGRGSLVHAKDYFMG